MNQQIGSRPDNPAFLNIWYGIHLDAGYNWQISSRIPVPNMTDRYPAGYRQELRLSIIWLSSADIWVIGCWFFFLLMVKSWDYVLPDCLLLISEWLAAGSSSSWWSNAGTMYYLIVFGWYLSGWLLVLLPLDGPELRLCITVPDCLRLISEWLAAGSSFS